MEHVSEILDQVEIHQCDLRNSDQLLDLVREQAIVFLLAGQTSHIDSMHEPMLDLELNTRATLSLLECCRQANPSARIVFTSTRQIFGRAQYLPVDERHPVAPSDINGIHKLAAENYLQLYSQVYGLTCSVLRLTNTYGPRMDLHPRKGFVGIFLRQALQGELIRLFGNGQQVRDFNFVSDVVAALEQVGKSVERGYELFNLGHHEHHSLQEFVQTLAQFVPLQFECQPFPDDLKRIDIGDYYGCYDKLQQRTGWRPQVSLHEGLERTVAAYRNASSFSQARNSERPSRIAAFEYRGELARYRSELISAVSGVLDSGQLILGPEVAKFEQEFAQFVGAAHAVGISSGTDAIIVALRALGIGPGDEVITVANGPVPTIAAIRSVGAVPRFVDIDPLTMQIDVDLVERAITDKTRCVLPLHLYGYPADTQRLAELCRQRGLLLIEDCAQAHGTRLNGQHVGLLGDIGCFSFYPTKNLGAFGDAGMCITRDANLAAKLREQACYGFRGDRVAHSEGLNCRLDEIQAAMLRVKLRELPAALARRQAIAQQYTQGLQQLPIQLPTIMNCGQSSWHQYVIRTSQREQLISHLSGQGIDVGVHYATPIHLMPAYADKNLCACPLPITEQACREVISLPIYPELKDEQVARVIAAAQSKLTKN